MELIIHEAFINAAIQAVERQRPELLAAHSEGFHKTILFPYNQNEPSKPTKLEASKAEVDFATKASKGVVRLRDGQLDAELFFDSTVKRTRETTSEVGSFQLGASVSLEFSTRQAEGFFPLQLLDLRVRDLQPNGLASLVSWIAMEGLFESTAKSGLPRELVLFEGKLKILLDSPLILNQKLQLRGKIK